MIEKRLRVLLYALYDWGNSSFTTLVVTFIYSTYFTKAMAPDQITGTALWSRAVTATALIVALASPLLGAWADRGGHRRALLAASSLLCIGATAALTFVTPGHWLAALVVFTLANVGFEQGMVFYNSFLPDIADRHDIGRISGWAWGLGYAGGLCCLALALVGFVTERPWFGLSTAHGFNIRATNLLTAAWFAVFGLPFVLFFRGRTHKADRSSRAGTAARGGRFLATLGRLRRYPQALRFLIARLLYNDGLITIFAFGGIYAAGTFGMTFRDIIVFGIALNVAAGLGAFAFGWLDDRAGAKTTVQVSNVALAGAVTLAVLTRSLALFWVAALAIGLFAGPNQSASRSLLARFTPAEREGEFFGFYALSGKFTSFLGPLFLGLVTQLSGSQRWGMSTLLLFFVVGGLLLAGVDEAAGVKAAAAVHSD